MIGATAMASKRRVRLKRVPVSSVVSSQVYDRRTSDLLRNSVVAPIQVEDPWEPGAYVLVMRSLRDDPLAAMHDRKQVDVAQYSAGRHWQRAWELAGLGSVKAIDTTKEAVDGGRFIEPLSDSQARALGDLKKAALALGLEGESITRDILGGCMPLLHAAAKRGLTSETELKYIGRRFRECLETLAVLFGYAGGK